jgi:ABC-type multidrug transport system ATPase subunit
MSITPPENDGDYLHMFCMEERMLRELFWAGFGFQVWCQLLTHLDRGREDSILVVDEPEIYLHPDLQRKLFTILSSLGPSIVMATHSAEIISAAVSEDVLLIDKKALSARRLSPGGTAQLALDAIGSSHKVLHEKNAKTQRLPLLPSQSISEDVVSIENKAERNSRLSPQEFITSTPDEVKPSHSSPRPNKLQAQRLPFVPIKGTERLRRDE